MPSDHHDVEPDGDSLRNLVAKSRKASKIVGWIANIEDVHEPLYSDQVAEELGLSASDVRDVLKEIDALGYGSFRYGRRGHGTRLEPTEELFEHAREIANGLNSIQSDVDDEPVHLAPTTTSHPFRLRRDLQIAIDLPYDFNKADAERLCNWVRTLPVD